MKADCANCKAHACYTKGTNCTGIDRETVLEAYKAIVPALSIDKASSWPFNEAGDMRSRLL